ncbi:MAG: hypothetical protein ACTSXG_01240 [Alphaproteobacteria bacterium]
MAIIIAFGFLDFSLSMDQPEQQVLMNKEQLMHEQELSLQKVVINLENFEKPKDQDEVLDRYIGLTRTKAFIELAKIVEQPEQYRQFIGEKLKNLKTRLEHLSFQQETIDSRRSHQIITERIAIHNLNQEEGWLLAALNNVTKHLEFLIQFLTNINNIKDKKTYEKFLQTYHKYLIYEKIIEAYDDLHHQEREEFQEHFSVSMANQREAARIKAHKKKQLCPDKYLVGKFSKAIFPNLDFNPETGLIKTLRFDGQFWNAYTTEGNVVHQGIGQVNIGWANNEEQIVWNIHGLPQGYSWEQLRNIFQPIFDRAKIKKYQWNVIRTAQFANEVGYYIMKAPGEDGYDWDNVKVCKYDLYKLHTDNWNWNGFGFEKRQIVVLPVQEGDEKRFEPYNEFKPFERRIYALAPHARLAYQNLETYRINPKDTGQQKMAKLSAELKDRVARIGGYFNRYQEEIPYEMRRLYVYGPGPYFSRYYEDREIDPRNSDILPPHLVYRAGEWGDQGHPDLAADPYEIQRIQKEMRYNLQNPREYRGSAEGLLALADNYFEQAKESQNEEDHDHYMRLAKETEIEAKRAQEENDPRMLYQMYERYKQQSQEKYISPQRAEELSQLAETYLLEAKSIEQKMMIEKNEQQMQHKQMFQQPQQMRQQKVFTSGSSNKKQQQLRQQSSKKGSTYDQVLQQQKKKK